MKRTEPDGRSGEPQRRKRVVLLALGGNLVIAVAKFTAAFMTGSSAMVAAALAASYWPH